MKNKNFITNGNMPDMWYIFSYFVMIVSSVDILSMVASILHPDNAMARSASMILTTILLGFVLIEGIIATYFKTDGFKNSR